MKIETPNRRLEVVKTGQTRGSSQGDPRRERPPKGFYAHDFMKMETPNRRLGVVKTGQTRGSSQGGVKEEKATKRILRTRFHENRNTKELLGVSKRLKHLQTPNRCKRCNISKQNVTSSENSLCQTFSHKN